MSYTKLVMDANIFDKNHGRKIKKKRAPKSKTNLIINQNLNLRFNNKQKKS